MKEIYSELSVTDPEWVEVISNFSLDEVVKEMIYQATAYLGIGRVFDFLVCTNEIMEQHGISLPLQPQGKTTKDTRFDAGLAKQVELFGQGMLERQKNLVVLEKMLIDG